MTVKRRGLWKDKGKVPVKKAAPILGSGLAIKPKPKPVVAPVKKKAAPVKAGINAQLQRQLEDVYLNNYSEAPKGAMQHLLEMVAGRKHTPASALDLAKRGYGQDPLAIQAAQHVSGILDPQLAANKFSQLQAQTGATKAVNQYKEMGQDTDQDLQAIYHILQKELGVSRDAVKAGSDQTVAAVGNNYEALKAALGKNFSGAQEGVAAELARLGLAQAQPDATKQLLADQAYLTGQADVNKASQQSILQAQGQGHYGVMQQAVNNSKASGTQKRADAMQKTLSDVNATNMALQEAIAELEQEYNTVSGTRRAKISDTLSELRAAQAETQAEMRKQEFAEMLAGEKLGLDRSRLTLDTQKAQSDRQIAMGKLDLESYLGKGKLSLDQQKLAVEERQFEIKNDLETKKFQLDQVKAQAEREMDPIKRQLMQNQIASIQQGIAASEQERIFLQENGGVSPNTIYSENATAAKDALKAQKDQDAADLEAMTAPQKGYPAAMGMVAGAPKVQAVLKELLDGTYGGGPFNPNDKAAMGAHLNAANDIANKGKLSSAEKDNLRTAVMVAYGEISIPAAHLNAKAPPPPFKLTPGLQKAAEKRTAPKKKKNKDAIKRAAGINKSKSMTPKPSAPNITNLWRR